MGSNMAEWHPVGFQWVLEARLKGATLIHVDPRFTRTSANASIHVPIRPGADITFLGGIVNHVLQNGREFREYVVAYTNAAALVAEDFRDTDDLDCLFSGWDPGQRAYDTTSWRLSDQRDETRSSVEARVVVTDRVRPVRLGSRLVHQVGLPYHWGSRGLSRGDSANDLLSIVLDPNVHIQESKVATATSGLAGV